ncbi:11200_t:CDS:2 [Funneliformis caledonium]|uniref:11200_t:CDS:1 n=1 Tax=Funneliformis caledonium TaxID=1117310 RepID=A0A9N9AQV0_9GLOM|nr:11200_t:CDS:2 [Funneliformis caledonium]
MYDKIYYQDVENQFITNYLFSDLQKKEKNNIYNLLLYCIRR